MEWVKNFYKVNSVTGDWEVADSIKGTRIKKIRFWAKLEDVNNIYAKII